MKFLKLSAICASLGLAACSTITPEAYQAETPKMDFITYFSGTTHGYGAIFSRSGKVTDRFHVVMHGTTATNTRGERTLQLAEDFTYTSGKTQKRAWSVIETAPGRLYANAADVPGHAVGVQSGNAVQFKYPLTITRDNGKKIDLQSSDWMWMVPAGGSTNVVINRNQLSKYGFNVAELVITFTKTP